MTANNTAAIRRIRRTRTGRDCLSTTILTCILLLPLVVPSQGAVHTSARSTAMGGAFTALAKGVEAPKYNPANLGLADYWQNGIEIVSVGASINNNSFTLSDYNNYTGATLTTADKQDILSKIPNDGLRVDTDLRASALSVALGKFALSVTGMGAAKINLNKDVIDLLLNGNTIADSISVTGSYSEGHSFATVGLSYGTPIYNGGTRQLAVGLTARYIRGIAVEKMVELEGLAATFATGFTGQGRAVVQTATGGSGYGLDVGAVLKLNDAYTVGIRFENLLGHINWNNNPQEHGYIFEFDTAVVSDFDEDFVVSDDYTIDIDAFSTSLPAIMNVGVGGTSGKLLWGLDWNQGFKRAPGASTKPRLSLGVEYPLISFLPIRLGYTMGGDNPTAFSFGSGLNFSGFYLDVAILTGTSFSVYSAKGANLAVSTGWQF